MSSVGIKVLKRKQVQVLKTHKTRVREARKSMSSLSLIMLHLIGGKRGFSHCSQCVLDIYGVISGMIHKILYGEKANFSCLKDFEKHICVFYLKLSSF